MKTKDEILKEAQDHFGVNVFANDDGISRRIEHYAMDLWAQEVVKNNLAQADVIKSVCVHQWMHPSPEDGGKSECVKCGIRA